MEPNEIQVFEDLTDEEAGAIFDLFPVLEVEDGMEVVVEGSGDSSVYIVLSGAFEVLVQTPEGGERGLTTMGVGEVFGELSFLDDLPRSATVRATTASEVLRLDRAGFAELELKQPTASTKIYRDLARVATRRLRLANEKIAEDAVP